MQVTNLHRLALYLFLQSFGSFLIHKEFSIMKQFKKSKKKIQNYATMRCPYCGGPVVFRSADGIYKDNKDGTMLYVCSHYPECDAYVRVRPGTRIPMGTMADGNLRSLRIATHRQFDKLHKQGFMTREEAYLWLAHTIAAPLSQAHIGYLSEYYCNLVIQESSKLLTTKQAMRIASKIKEA